MQTEFRDSDHAIMDACFATYKFGNLVWENYLYCLKHLSCTFPLIDHELGENNGHPRVRMRIWRGWWVCTAPKIKWWWMIARLDECSFQEALKYAWALTYMQRNYD